MKKAFTIVELVTVIASSKRNKTIKEGNDMLIKLNLQRFATSQVSIDLTTLSGWGNVADGQHSIQVVAKADGYRDSEPSAAVSVTKGAEQDELSGTWVFNDNPDLSGSGAINVNVNFTSNESDFTNMSIIKGSGPSGAIQYDELEVCSSMIGWNNKAYKTITITSKLTEVEYGNELLEFLQANATKQ